MRKWLQNSMIGLGLVAASATAIAGLKINSPVVVNRLTRCASGALGSARNSADSTQFIGCSVLDTTGGAIVSCSARNSAGVIASCRSSDPGKVSAATSINSDSHVAFCYDPVGVCTSLTVSTFSYYPPKAH